MTGKGDNAMKGLLLKDFYNLKGSAKQMIFMVVLMAAWCAFLKNSTFFAMITMMYSAMLMLTSISYDEAAHFDKYELTLPITRKDMVRAKYLLLLLLILAGLLIGTAGSFIIRSLVKGMDNLLVEDMLSIASVACFFLMAFSIMLPIILKIGVEKARMILVVVYIGLFGAMAGIVYIAKDLGIALTDRLVATGVAVGAAVTVLVVIGSYLAALKVVREKEW